MWVLHPQKVIPIIFLFFYLTLLRFKVHTFQVHFKILQLLSLLLIVIFVLLYTSFIFISHAGKIINSFYTFSAGVCIVLVLVLI